MVSVENQSTLFSSIGTPKRPLHITQEGRFLVFKPASKQTADLVTKAGTSLTLLERATSHDHRMARVKDFKKLFPVQRTSSSTRKQPTDVRGLSQQVMSPRGASQRGLPQGAISQRGLPRGAISQRGLPQGPISQRGLPRGAISQRGLPQLLKALPADIRKSYTIPVRLPLIVERSQS